MKLQFSTRCVLLFIAAAACILAYNRHVDLRKSLKERLTVDSQAEFDRRCARGNCLTLVHGDWSPNCTMFLKSLLEVAREGRGDDFLPVIVDRSHTLNQKEVDALVHSLLAGNHPPNRTMKTFGGSGLVFWTTEGKVVDSEWCSNLIAHGVRNNIEDRSNVNFRPSIPSS